MAPKMNTRKKAAKKNDKDPTDIGKCNALLENTSTSSPLNCIKATLTRKRKFFSAKDDENENKEITTPRTRAKPRKSNVNEISLAICNRELENARQSRSRIPQKSRASIQAKKSKKSVYSMSGESDGEDASFQTRKRITRSSRIRSTTTMSRKTSKKSRASIQAKKSGKFHYSMSGESDGKDSSFLKRKVASSTSLNSNLWNVWSTAAMSTKHERSTNIADHIDAKTKKANEIFDKIKENGVNDENITLVEKKSDGNDLCPYNLSSDSEEGDLTKEKVSALVSPLPDLVVEPEKTRLDLTCSIEANLLQNIKKHDFNQTDDTGHLLLNADEIDYAVLELTEINETALVSDVLSERSIATGGRSPITGHNDLNESPPNVELLDEDFQHRDVHNEWMSESMAEFFTNMRNELLTNIPITRMSTEESALSNLRAKTMSSEESIHNMNTESNKSKPNVVLERTPTKEIESKLDPIGSPKNIVDLTMSSDDSVRRALQTRSCTKSMTSNATNIDKEPHKTVSIQSSVPKEQTSENDQRFIKNSQENGESDKAPASVDRCDVNRSIARVEDWFKRNATPNSPSAGDNHAITEMLSQVMETLQTTLVEIRQATGERLIAAFLEDYDDLTSLQQEVRDNSLAVIRVQEKIAQLKENQKKRAIEVIRAEVEQNARMVKILQEDIQRLFN